MRLNRLLASVAVLAMTVSAATAQTLPVPPQSSDPVEVEIDQGVSHSHPMAVRIA